MALIVVGILGVGCGLVAIGISGDKDVSDIHPPASSQILDINGNLITNIHATENRTLVTLDKIPKNLQNAFIAVEDNRFMNTAVSTRAASCVRCIPILSAAK